MFDQILVGVMWLGLKVGNYKMVGYQIIKIYFSSQFLTPFYKFPRNISHSISNFSLHFSLHLLDLQGFLVKITGKHCFLPENRLFLGQKGWFLGVFRWNIVFCRTKLNLSCRFVGLIGALRLDIRLFWPAKWDLGNLKGSR